MSWDSTEQVGRGNRKESARQTTGRRADGVCVMGTLGTRISKDCSTRASQNKASLEHCVLKYGQSVNPRGQAEKQRPLLSVGPRMPRYGVRLCRAGKRRSATTSCVSGRHLLEPGEAGTGGEAGLMVRGRTCPLRALCST